MCNLKKFIIQFSFQEVVNNKDVDCIVATMKFPNGVIGILDFARCSCYGYDIRLEVLPLTYSNPLRELFLYLHSMHYTNSACSNYTDIRRTICTFVWMTPELIQSKPQHKVCWIEMKTVNDIWSCYSNPYWC